MTVEDERTCDVCGAPVADALRGFAGGLRICNAHLEAWRASPERREAMLEMVRTGGGMTEAFEAWATHAREAK